MILSATHFRAAFDIFIIGLRLLLLAIAALAFLMVFLGAIIASPSIDVWSFCAMGVALFNGHLMFKHLDSAGLKPIVAYSISSVAIFATSPVFVPNWYGLN